MQIFFLDIASVDEWKLKMKPSLFPNSPSIYHRLCISVHRALIVLAFILWFFLMLWLFGRRWRSVDSISGNLHHSFLS